jgi:CO/xanthine dehydrogenase FAD-binding subunit
MPETGLGRILRKGNSVVIGAAVPLEKLLETPDLPQALHQAIRAETSVNLRQVATAAGTLVTADGRSPFTTVLLAMDASLALASLDFGRRTLFLSELFLSRTEELPGFLILSVNLPATVHVSYRAITRTPADFPIVAAVVCRWPSGRTRAVLAGYGAAPLLAFDGPDDEGIKIAAREAYLAAGDEWASAAYRNAMAELLVERCLHDIANGG